MMKKGIIILLMFACCVLTARGQDAAADFKKMNETYLKANSFRADVFVKIYFRDNTEGISEYSGKVYKSGDSYFSDMMGITRLANPRCRIMVNHDMKNISYSPGKGKSETNDLLDYRAIIDTIMMQYTQVKVIENKAGTVTYEITYKAGHYLKKSQVTINRVNYTLTRVVYFYGEAYPETDKVVIEYTNVLLNPVIPEKEFSEYKYIQKANGKVIPAAAYKGYSINRQ